jgi:hypothetical protein
MGRSNGLPSLLRILLGSVNHGDFHEEMGFGFSKPEKRKRNDLIEKETQ